MGKASDLAKCLYGFFSPIAPSFLEGTVPNGTPFPYITYSLSYEDWFIDGNMQVRIWTKSSSMAKVTELTDAILDKIGYGVAEDIPNGGTIVMKKGSPLWQFVPDEDENIKTTMINITYNIYKY